MTTTSSAIDGSGQDSLDRIERIERPEPIVKAEALAYVIFERRDVPEMTRFLRDFGFLPVEGAWGGSHYFRGHGPSPYLVVIEESERDHFKGIGLTARSAEDFEHFAAAVGVASAPAQAPGGGVRVRVTDPGGLQVDLVHGAAKLPELPTRDRLVPVNIPARRQRVNEGVRTALEPSPIFRIGHVVLERPDFGQAAQWYMRHFGLIPSDVQAFPSGKLGLGFFRLDRGAEPSDHHTVAILGGAKTGVLHVAFETFDLESVGQGHQYLRARGWTPYWGIGRHMLGSQLFDYWKDSAGDEWEHYADGDVLDAAQPTGYHWLTRGGLWAWGDDLPDSMRPDVPLDRLEDLHAAGAFGDLPLEKARDLFTALQVQPRPWMR